MEVKAPSNHVKRGGSSSSHIKHGKAMIDNTVLWEGWMNKHRGHTTEEEERPK